MVYVALVGDAERGTRELFYASRARLGSKRNMEDAREAAAALAGNPAVLETRRAETRQMGRRTYYVIEGRDFLKSDIDCRLEGSC
jgi:uncharacterized protein YpmB